MDDKQLVLAAMFMPAALAALDVVYALIYNYIMEPDETRYTFAGNYYIKWKDERWCDSWDCFEAAGLLSLGGAIVSTLIVALLVEQPLVLIVAGVSYAVLRLARASVRFGKKLTAHIEDVDAHKGGD